MKHDRERDKFGGDDLHLNTAVDIRSQSSGHDESDAVIDATLFMRR